MSRPTQKDLILDMLKRWGDAGVTPAEALAEVGCFRLAARIAELRAEGHNIETKSYKTKGGAVVARYVLERQVVLEQMPMFAAADA